MIQLQEEIDRSTMIVRNFNIPYSIIDRASRQKVIKDIENLINTINQLDLSDIYNTPPCDSKTHILFMSISKYAKIDHILSHKTSLSILEGFRFYRVCSLTTTEINEKSVI